MEPLRLRMLVTVEDTDRQAAALRVGVPHAEGPAVRDAVRDGRGVSGGLTEKLPLPLALPDPEGLPLALWDGWGDAVSPDPEGEIDGAALALALVMRVGERTAST